MTILDIEALRVQPGEVLVVRIDPSAFCDVVDHATDLVEVLERAGLQGRCCVISAPAGAIEFAVACPTAEQAQRRHAERQTA